MAQRKTLLPNDLYDYSLEVSLREPPVLKKLREETSKLPGAQMQIASDQGQFMAMLAKLIHAKRILEVGTFTGYSALVMASVLPADGKLITIDRDGEVQAIAKRYCHEMGLDNKVEFIEGDAGDVLKQLKGSFDMAFLDGNQRRYQAFFELLFALVRQGGLILIDNVLKSGMVLDPGDNEAAKAIDALNQSLYQDPRVEISMLPIADGLSLVRKL